MLTINDAFNNCGLPQYNSASDLNKNDIATIKEQLKNMFAWFGVSFINSESYNILKNYVNNYCVACRWYSLIIK